MVKSLEIGHSPRTEGESLRGDGIERRGARLNTMSGRTDRCDSARGEGTEGEGIPQETALFGDAFSVRIRQLQTAEAENRDYRQVATIIGLAEIDILTYRSYNGGSYNSTTAESLSALLVTIARIESKLGARRQDHRSSIKRLQKKLRVWYWKYGRTQWSAGSFEMAVKRVWLLSPLECCVTVKEYPVLMRELTDLNWRPSVC